MLLTCIHLFQDRLFKDVSASLSLYLHDTTVHIIKYFSQNVLQTFLVIFYNKHN
nr:MAG TPA: hypothetical protein [Caudoviricetes sp.]